MCVEYSIARDVKLSVSVIECSIYVLLDLNRCTPGASGRKPTEPGRSFEEESVLRVCVLCDMI